MVENLKRKIEQAKTIVADIRNQREASVYDKDTVLTFPPFPTYEITKSIAKVFKNIKAETLKEKNIYNPNFESHILPDADEVVSETHSYIESFENTIDFYSVFDYPVSKLEHYNEEIGMTNAELNLYKTVSAEFEYASENMAELGYVIATLNKMKSAIDAIGQKHIKDALTVLKTAKKSDPNNRSLAYVISQILYFRSQNGATESLPEARSEAKKSCLYSEGCDAQQLLQYRYIYVLHECNFDSKKAVNLMREFYLLNPESLTEGSGLCAHEGIHLKSWLLLSTLEPELLTTFEIESLFTIVSTAPSGVNFYLNVMRPMVLNRLEDETDVAMQKLIKIEEMIAISHSLYSNIAAEIQQNYDDKGNLTPASEYQWTIEMRYTCLLLKAAKTPKFDEIYLYTSLDAKRHSSEAYPNRAMGAMGLTNVNYWQVWSLAITSAEGKSSSRTLPVARVALHAELFRKFDEILKLIAEYEKELIPEEKWQIIKKYMPNYEYGIFPHVAAGPDAFKAPSNPYYLNFYRQWVKERPVGQLPSNILKEYAEKGHFIDADEVIAAFEGVVRVVVDDVHGLKSRAKTALKACLSDSKSGKSEKAKDLLREGHFNDFWWLYVIVLPLAILAFFAVAGGGSAMTLLIIVLFAAGLGYGMYSMSKEKPDGDSSIDQLEEGESKPTDTKGGD